MPNQRAPGQKLIAIAMKEEFIAFINQALQRLHYSDRSDFIREAIKEKLSGYGFDVPEGLEKPPYRAGKIKRYPASRQAGILKNEKDRPKKG